MNFFADLGLIISIILLFFTALTKNEKYNLEKIKKINLILASLILLIWLFHDMPGAIAAFQEGVQEGFNAYQNK